MPEQPGDELAFCEQRSASKSVRVIGSNTPVKSTRSIVVRMFESRLDTTGDPAKAYPAGKVAPALYGFHDSGLGNMLDT
jgi:hypothetical protein